MREEPGANAVGAILEKVGRRAQPVHMTEVNYAEVQYIVLRNDGDAAWDVIARELPAVPIEFHPATRALADTAADLKARFPLSLADAFAAALAKENKAALSNDDSEFKPREKEIKIHWLK